MNEPKPRVLVADNDAHMRGLIGDVLSLLGAEVVAQAADGEQALDLFEQHRPDAVVLDIALSKLSGDAVLDRIVRGNPKVLCIDAHTLRASLCDLMAARSKAYRRTLSRQVADLDETWKMALAEEPRRLGLLQELQRRAHAMAGTSSAYGFEELAQTARKCETVFARLAGDTGVFVEEDKIAVFVAWRALRRVARDFTIDDLPPFAVPASRPESRLQA